MKASTNDESVSLKGVCREILTLGFSHESVSPRALSIIPMGLFRILSKIRRNIREWMFITVVPRGPLIHEKNLESRVRLSLIDNASRVLKQIIHLIFFCRCRHNTSM